MKTLEVEICVDSVDSAISAEAGGATRIELCASLSEGGITPSAGMIEVTKKSIRIPVHVLVRPRRGDFLYSAPEFEMMKRDIRIAKELGAEGIVLGILKADGQVDGERTAELIALAAPLSVTFHRAFDMTPDPYKALEDIIQLKVDRLLTSGQQHAAIAGADLIAKLIKVAGSRLIIMPGGGINSENISELIARTGAGAYHASARTRVNSKMRYQNQELMMAGNHPLTEYENLVADANLIKSIRKAAGHGTLSTSLYPSDEGSN